MIEGELLALLGAVLLKTGMGDEGRELWSPGVEPKGGALSERVEMVLYPAPKLMEPMLRVPAGFVPALAPSSSTSMPSLVVSFLTLSRRRVSSSKTLRRLNRRFMMSEGCLFSWNFEPRLGAALLGVEMGVAEPEARGVWFPWPGVPDGVEGAGVPPTLVDPDHFSYFSSRAARRCSKVMTCGSAAADVSLSDSERSSLWLELRFAAFTSTLRESGDSALVVLDKLGFAVDEVELEGVATCNRPASRGSWGLLALLGVFIAMGLAEVDSEKESKL